MILKWINYTDNQSINYLNENERIKKSIALRPYEI